ncbi:hypothetical protein PENTCL1PPCAC_16718, partial [Pristionchus entomophagus]
HEETMSAHFGDNSTFLSTYRPQATALSSILWCNLVPVAFIAYCSAKHAKKIRGFEEWVLFPIFTQAVMSLPQTFFLTWLAVFVRKNTPTTILTCTSIKLV